jgi:hypothetical protein
MKKYSCEHSLGYSVIQRYETLQGEVVSGPIGRKRKRGRPKKVGRAWDMDQLE